ncbi:MAG TPA: sigma-70 family RNA polymerase sigma factor [Solirubrobacteraceae bacterium]|nr:sigma-70 family RNA polymerase sigma factor [Solirubrobacteraceae bacterium]
MALEPFQEVLDDHRDHVLRFLVAAAGPDDADDCFQETFLAALRAYPRLRPDSNIRAWLLTIAQRKAIDAHRARTRRPLPVSDPEPAGHAAPPGLDGEAALWRAVHTLPERQRAAVLLRYFGDLSHREVGRAMNGSEAAARRNVHDGLKKLREALA